MTMIGLKIKKLQYGIKRKAAEISALSSGKIFKYEDLTSEEILPLGQQKIIDQAKFTYFPLGNAFEKQIETIEHQGKKQVEALKDLKIEEQNAVEDISDDVFSMQNETYFIKSEN